MSALRVGVDVRMLGKTGIGVYLAEVLRRLPRHLPGAEFVAFGGRVPGCETVPVAARVYSLAEQIDLPLAAASRDLDVFWSPHYNAPLLSPARLVVTVHDLIHLRFRGQLPRPRWLSYLYARTQIRRACARARIVLTPSESTRRDLVHMLGVPTARIRVTPEAVGEDLGPVRSGRRLDAFRRSHGLRAPYVLFVSNLKPHKNPEGLIRAFAAMRDRRVTLVLAGQGSPGYAAALRELATRLGVGARVRFPGKIRRDDLRYWYAGAAVFACPSFSEGFGLPPLEAFACGAPVVASNAASLPEVVGNAALTVAPGDSAGMARALDAVIAHPALRRRLVAAGLRRVRRFSWDRTAALTADALRAAAGR